MNKCGSYVENIAISRADKQAKEEKLAKLDSAMDETAGALEDVRKSLRAAGFHLDVQRSQTLKKGVFRCVIRPFKRRGR